MSQICEYGHGRCTAPNTKCPHWMRIFCELDATYTPKAKPKVVIFDETPIKKDLYKES